MSKNNWTEEELCLLRDNIDKPVTELIKMFPRHVRNAIYFRRDRILNEGYIPFTEEENSILIERYNNKVMDRELVEVLNNLESNKRLGITRTVSDIRNRWRELRHDGVVPIKRPYKKSRVSRPGYNKLYYEKTRKAANSHKKYTWYELNLIMNSDLTDMQLSKMIGRSVKAIQVKRSKINTNIDRLDCVED